MGSHWTSERPTRVVDLWPEEAPCARCGRRMKICDHRHRRVETLPERLHLVCRLTHCPDQDCAAHSKTYSPPEELSIALPRVVIGEHAVIGAGSVLFPVKRGPVRQF